MHCTWCIPVGRDEWTRSICTVFVSCSKAVTSLWALYVSLQVSVLNIEGVQGLEYRALILSTVRTCTTEPGDSDEGSFLSSPKVCASDKVLV